MDKAILVIDMPDSCDKCSLFHGFYSDMTCGANNYSINYPYPKDFRQDWCPLQRAPEEQEIWFDDERSDWERGYNNCLREIVGH
jgi:hypothetical protein